MKPYQFAALLVLLSFAQPCLANREPAASMSTVYPIRGSSSAWLFHAFAIACQPGTPAILRKTEPVVVDLDAPLVVKTETTTVPATANETPDLSPYIAYLQSELKRTWHPHKAKRLEKGLATVAFYLSKTGEITNIHTSAFAGTSDSLDRALKRISPLKPLPGGSKDIELTLMFDYVKEDK